MPRSSHSRSAKPGTFEVDPRLFSQGLGKRFGESLSKPSGARLI